MGEYKDNTYISSYTAEQIEQAITFVHTQVAEPFSTEKTYNLHDYVIYNGLLYECTTAVTAAGGWNSSYWTVQRIFDNNGYIIYNGGTESENI